MPLQLSQNSTNLRFHEQPHHQTNLPTPRGGQMSRAAANLSYLAATMKRNLSGTSVATDTELHSSSAMFGSYQDSVDPLTLLFYKSPTLEKWFLTRFYCPNRHSAVVGVLLLFVAFAIVSVIAYREEIYAFAAYRIPLVVGCSLCAIGTFSAVVNLALQQKRLPQLQLTSDERERNDVNHSDSNELVRKDEISFTFFSWWEISLVLEHCAAVLLCLVVVTGKSAGCIGADSDDVIDKQRCVKSVQLDSGILLLLTGHAMVYPVRWVLHVPATFLMILMLFGVRYLPGVSTEVDSKFIVSYAMVIGVPTLVFLAVRYQRESDLRRVFLAELQLESALEQFSVLSARRATLLVPWVPLPVEEQVLLLHRTKNHLWGLGSQTTVAVVQLENFSRWVVHVGACDAARVLTKLVTTVDKYYKLLAPLSEAILKCHVDGDRYFLVGPHTIDAGMIMAIVLCACREYRHNSVSSSTTTYPPINAGIVCGVVGVAGIGVCSTLIPTGPAVDQACELISQNQCRKVAQPVVAVATKTRTTTSSSNSVTHTSASSKSRVSSSTTTPHDADDDDNDDAHAVSFVSCQAAVASEIVDLLVTTDAARACSQLRYVIQQSKATTTTTTMSNNNNNNMFPSTTTSPPQSISEENPLPSSHMKPSAGECAASQGQHYPHPINVSLCDLIDGTVFQSVSALLHANSGPNPTTSRSSATPVDYLTARFSLALINSSYDHPRHVGGARCSKHLQQSASFFDDAPFKQQSLARSAMTYLTVSQRPSHTVSDVSLRIAPAVQLQEGGSTTSKTADVSQHTSASDEPPQNVIALELRSPPEVSEVALDTNASFVAVCNDEETNVERHRLEEEPGGAADETIFEQDIVNSNLRMKRETIFLPQKFVFVDRAVEARFQQHCRDMVPESELHAASLGALAMSAFIILVCYMNKSTFLDVASPMTFAIAAFVLSVMLVLIAIAIHGTAASFLRHVLLAAHEFLFCCFYAMIVGISYAIEPGTSALGDTQLVWLFMMLSLNCVRPRVHGLFPHISLDFLGSALLIVQASAYPYPSTTLRNINILGDAFVACGSLFLHTSLDLETRQRFIVEINLDELHRSLVMLHGDIDKLLATTEQNNPAAIFVARAQRHNRKLSRVQASNNPELMSPLCVDNIDPSVSTTTASHVMDSGVLMIEFASASRRGSSSSTNNNNNNNCNGLFTTTDELKHSVSRAKQFISNVDVLLGSSKFNQALRIVKATANYIVVLPDKSVMGRRSGGGAPDLPLIELGFDVVRLLCPAHRLIGKAIIDSGPLVGVLLGTTSISLEFTGPVISRAKALLHEAPWGSCFVTRRLLQYSGVACEQSYTLQTPSGLRAQTSGTFQTWRVQGMPKVAVAAVT